MLVYFTYSIHKGRKETIENKIENESFIVIEKIENIDDVSLLSESQKEKEDLVLTEHEYKIYSPEEQKQVLMEQPTSKHFQELITIIDPQPGETVADIGCGTAPLPYLLSKAVGKDGRVFATDIHDGVMRYHLIKRRVLAQENDWKYDNIFFMLNELHDLLLREEILDKAILSGVHIFNYDPKNTYGSDVQQDGPRRDKNGNILKKEIIKDIISGEYPQASFAKSIYSSMKPGGKLLIIEWIDTPQWALGEKEVQEVMETFGFKLEEYCEKKIPGHAIWIFKRQINKP